MFHTLLTNSLHIKDLKEEKIIIVPSVSTGCNRSKTSHLIYIIGYFPNEILKNRSLWRMCGGQKGISQEQQQERKCGFLMYSSIRLAL